MKRIEEIAQRKLRDIKIPKIVRVGALLLWNTRWTRLLLFCIPIIIYFLPLLLTGKNEAPGDPDYYFGLYEGFRKTVLDYHQFPWWDPWISGGVPLFGNVQFGLISISAPLVLVFGTPIGLKLSLLLYGVIAFFGARRLFLRYFKTSEVRSIALAYVFAFCGFFAARAYMGHFTFSLAAYTPWAVYYYLYLHEKRVWIKFAVVLALLIDTAPHYTAIMTVDILALLFIAETVRMLWRRHDKLVVAAYKQRIKEAAKAAVLFILLVGVRMFYVLNFYNDYHRALDLASEKFTTVQNGFLAMWWYPNFTTAPARGLTWSWGEIETYIGTGTFLAVSLILVAWLHYKKNFARQFSRSIVFLLLLFLIFFALGMGDFSRFSPYAIAQKLPLFNAMRVATRWIFWDACIVLIIIAAYKGKRFARTITFLCIVAAVELLIRYPVLISQAYNMPVSQYRSATASFYQDKYNRVPRASYANNKQLVKKYWYDQNLYESTMNNIGEPLASDSLLYKTFLGETYRCQYFPDRIPCPFVVTNNARVTYWSPDEIKLVRTGPGPIDLDMNPGRGWRVNNVYVFGALKSVTATDYFKFDYSGKQKTFDIVYAPKLSPSYIWWKLHHF